MMEIVVYTIENQLLTLTLYVAASLLVIRWVLLVPALGIRADPPYPVGHYLLKVVPQILIPLHHLIRHKPIYACGRIVFHICLLAVPLGLHQHSEMWQEAGIDWEPFLLSDAAADMMTLFVLSSLLYLGARRFFLSRLRTESVGFDYLLLGIAGLPFLTGYLEAHGQLAFIPWMEDNLYTLHVLSGEAFILTMGFLICRTKLHPHDCTACAACTLSCPTGTLAAHDEAERRRIFYSHHQCICCGACVAICPEHAARLRHAFALPSLFRLHRKTILSQNDLVACRQCGLTFVPEMLLQKIRQTNTDDCVGLCPACRRQNHAQELFRQIRRNALTG